MGLTHHVPDGALLDFAGSLDGANAKHRMAAWMLLVVFGLPVLFYVLRLVDVVLRRRRFSIRARRPPRHVPSNLGHGDPHVAAPDAAESEPMEFPDVLSSATRRPTRSVGCA